MFTLSQTGLEKAVGAGCLLINSPQCAQGGFSSPSFCFSDRSGNHRPRGACTHRESDPHADAFACCVGPHVTLCVNPHSSSFLKLEHEASWLVCKTTLSQVLIQQKTFVL